MEKIKTKMKLKMEMKMKNKQTNKNEIESECKEERLQREGGPPVRTHLRTPAATTSPTPTLRKQPQVCAPRGPPPPDPPRRGRGPPALPGGAGSSPPRHARPRRATGAVENPMTGSARCTVG